MAKTVFITGATDGIGLATAKLLAGSGHDVLIHGRSETKLAETKALLAKIARDRVVGALRADLAKIADVEALVGVIGGNHTSVDVIINNAGVFATASPVTDDGYDVRFMVNAISPYLLTRRLLPLLPSHGRVINLSSAAQSPVSLDALTGKARLSDGQAYAQSKLALTMWSLQMAEELGEKTPAIIAVNPGSLLASKMVKDAYGVQGSDLGIGAEILARAAVSEAFAGASGKYFDNDQGRFSNPHPDALDAAKNEKLIAAMDTVIAKLGGKL